MADEAARIDAVYLHALQPNQYVTGSKVLSPEELTHAYLPDSSWSLAARAGYPHLRERGEWLRASGVNFLDLADIFKGVEETIYIDSCCHFNQTGFDIVGRRLAEALAEALPEETHARAAE